jgi:ubiquinone/menaquinone biosynthesis C-methylase UbiE
VAVRRRRAPLAPDVVTRANAAYHDAMADSYDEREEGTSPYVHDWYRQCFERDILPRVPRVERPRVLDLGCGSGYLEMFLPETMDITAVDISEGMLARAKERFPHVNFVRDDLYEWEPDGGFHLTMAKAVLHHLVDYERLVEKMARLTLPGGVMFISNEPNHLAYRYLAPLKWLFRQTVNRGRTEETAERLGEAEFEAMSEYHLFYGNGINAFALRRRLRELGFSEVQLFFSLRELFASLDEAWPKAKLNARVPNALADHFPLSRNFHLVAYR